MGWLDQADDKRSMRHTVRIVMQPDQQLLDDIQLEAGRLLPGILGCLKLWSQGLQHETTFAGTEN